MREPTISAGEQYPDTVAIRHGDELLPGDGREANPAISTRPAPADRARLDALVRQAQAQRTGKAA